MSDTRRLIQYIADCQEAIARINLYTDGLSRDAFLANPMTQDAVLRNLEILGEASRQISTRFPEFALNNPDLPLVAAWEMRNAIAHGYHQVDMDIVWNTIQTDLPDFAAALQRAL